MNYIGNLIGRDPWNHFIFRKLENSVKDQNTQLDKGTNPTIFSYGREQWDW